jgi:transcriptional regulator with XRE-family HTH domain
MSIGFKQLFGQRLAALRGAKGLEQHQLGRLVGKKDKYVSAIETGKTFPRPEMIPLLAKALGAPVSALFFFEGMDNDAKLLRKQIDSLLQTSDAAQLRKFLRHMLVALER